MDTKFRHNQREEKQQTKINIIFINFIGRILFCRLANFLC